METERLEYAIAGSHTEFLAWRNQDPWVRKSVIYLPTAEHAEGRKKGLLHRVGTWGSSPARNAAERLEG